MADCILLELGGVDKILLEDGSGCILIEGQAAVQVLSQINTSIHGTNVSTGIFGTTISTGVNRTEVNVRAL